VTPPNPEQVYEVPRLVYTPVVLGFVVLVLNIFEYWWALAAAPFILLGCLCAAPNLNLANGCLAYLAMLVGLIVTPFHPPLGLAIFAGTAAGLYAGALEQNLRMRAESDEAERCGD
jgi:hypothetical protein